MFQDSSLGNNGLGFRTQVVQQQKEIEFMNILCRDNEVWFGSHFITIRHFGWALISLSYDMMIAQEWCVQNSRKGTSMWESLADVIPNQVLIFIIKIASLSSCFSHKTHTKKMKARICKEQPLNEFSFLSQVTLQSLFISWRHHYKKGRRRTTGNKKKTDLQCKTSLTWIWQQQTLLFRMRSVFTFDHKTL